MSCTHISKPDLEAMIGPKAAAALVTSHGGRSVYIPRRESAGQAIEAVVGAEAMQILRQSFGGEDISLPCKAKAPTLKERIVPLIEAGLSHNEIAQALGCSWRYCAMVKSDLGMTRRKAPKPRRRAERKA